MIETESPLPPLRPLERHPQLEVDTFCTQCGYNLHAQPVTRDERLGIFICRCPECATYHPAGTGMTATSTWMSRLAVVLLLLWVLFVLNAIFWICIGLGAIQFGHLQTFSFSKMVTPDGREVEWGQTLVSNSQAAGWGMIYVDTKQAAPNVGIRTIRTLQRPANYPAWGWYELAFFVVGGAGMGVATGGLLVVFFWHWRRARYWMVMVLPFSIAAVIATVIYFDDEYGPLYRWAVGGLVIYAALEAAFIGLGIMIGRPIMRGMLRTFIPPRPRQHFAFLWRADRKAMPGSAVS